MRPAVPLRRRRPRRRARGARDLFAKDVARIVDPALDRITAPLTQNQIDALGSFIYNVGPGNFERSVLPALNSGDHRAVITRATFTTRIAS